MHKAPAGGSFFYLKARLSGSALRVRFAAVVALRIVFAGLLLAVINRFLPLGTSPLLLSAGAAGGVLLASACAFSRLRHAGFLLFLGALCLLWWGLIGVAGRLPLGGSWLFVPYAFELHLNLVCLAALIAALSTWVFWRVRAGVSIEAIAVALAGVSLFAGYRDFNFVGSRRPPFEFTSLLSDIAWMFRVDQLTVLVGLGLGTLLMLFAYFYFAVLPGKPSAFPDDPGVSLHRAPMSFRDALIFGAALISLFMFVAHELYLYYNQSLREQLRGIISNGVGESNAPGQSPLGFHSALGSSNQPAAVVRLEGDYRENPYSPMLYLRESALSDFNGHELVIASRAFDRDVPLVTPGEAYVGKGDASLQERVPLRQSVYLLSDQNNVFAVDAPLSIQPLKNPNPSRFRGAYHVYSMAPGFSLREAGGFEVGNPAWRPLEREHYLKTHPDPRYKELAHRLGAQDAKPLEKVFSVVQFLSKTSIYTLRPNHQVDPQDDPVAPFLFGDHRGYCVHFAHAMVYMFRSLGIPARIGTGYLTDLSQAKDGHILLRMSDRHAWAEVYVRDRGWVVFDVQPEQVEEAADTNVDQRLLEELMALLGPDEEILPSESLKGEQNVFESSPLMGAPFVWGTLAGLAVFCLLIKLYLHFGWLLPGGLYTRARAAHIAVAARLLDLGYRRDYGETRSEFRSRLTQQLDVDVLSTSQVLSVSAYAPDAEERISRGELYAALEDDLYALQIFPWWRRLWAFFNPASICNALIGRRW